MFRKLVVIILASLAVIDLATGADSEDPIVKITQGELRGQIRTSRNGRTFYEFLGVPFGKVPKRFELSEPVDSWNGTKNATKLGPWCLQYNFIFGGLTGQEDCLVLNVYTPKISETGEPLPVMVYIHGGGFVQGSANEFGGSYFMNQDVVLVAMNYRLGPLGLLNAGVKSAAGNQGFKDQILALKWVQENIKSFGGDPGKVVIFGQSAGGGAVSLLTLSPMSKGLFHGAISMSGAALCPFVDRKEPTLPQAQKLANLVDCPASDPEYMIQCLQRISSENIMKAVIPKHLKHLYFDVYDVPQFYPSMETYYNGDVNDATVFLAEEPLKLLTEGRFNKVPWITGTTPQEGIVVQVAPIIYNETLRMLINEEWGRVAPSIFLYHTTAKDPCKVSSQIRDFYFEKDENITATNRQGLVDMYGDRLFFECTRQTASLYSKFAPVYLYNFTHKSEHSVAQLVGWPEEKGLKSATHADDLQYLFDFPVVPYTPSILKGNPMEDFSDKFINLWLSFAKNGKPTDVWGSLKEWPMFNAEDKPMKWMEIDDDLQIQLEEASFTDRMKFWEELSPSLNNRKA